MGMVRAEKKQEEAKIRQEESKYKKLRSVFQAVAFSVVPVLAFYLMEFYEHTPWREVRPKAQFFNILLFELIAWLFFMFVKKGNLALQIVLSVAMLFGLINHYVMKFRSTPFVPWDVYSVRTAASVVQNYEFTLEIRVVIVTMLFAATLVMLHFWKYQLAVNLPIRMVAAAMIFTCLFQFTGTLQDEKFQTRNYLYPFLFTPAYMTKVNGMAVTFAMDLAYISVDKPKGYKKEEARKMLEGNKTETDMDINVNIDIDMGMDIGETGYPNIIVVMDEAFSDLAVLGNFVVNEDYMPFVHKLQKGMENTVTGTLYVSVCGGNTANSEFEFLTGNTMAFLPAGSIPYQQYIKEETPSLASYLRSLGYKTYAQHPYYANGWERESVYPRLGFDNLTFIQDYKNAKYIRKYVSDESSFQKIIQTYQEKEKGKPVFIFNVTMQNHGGYKNEYPDFSSKITVLESDNPALGQYLSLVRITDQAFGELIDFFKDEEEKTMIVFFGDHQPNDAIASSIWSEEKKDNRYQVPYVIWANFDIVEERNKDFSLNYLAANLLHIAEVPTPKYYDFLLHLQEKYPVISAVQGVIANDKEIDTYRKLQYYQLFDWEKEAGE